MAVCLEDGKHPRGWFRSTHLNSVASNTRERAMKTFAPHTANRIRVRLTVCFVQGCRSWGWAAPGPQSQRGGVNVLCFSVSLVGESCVPECQPAMYLSREHRRCETCPAGTGTAFIPSISLQKKQIFAHHTQEPTTPRTILAAAGGEQFPSKEEKLQHREAVGCITFLQPSY